MLNSLRHDPEPLLAPRPAGDRRRSSGLRDVRLDGAAGRRRRPWGHLPEGAPVPGRSHWFARVAWAGTARHPRLPRLHPALSVDGPPGAMRRRRHDRGRLGRGDTAAARLPCAVPGRAPPAAPAPRREPLPGPCAGAGRRARALPGTRCQAGCATCWTCRPGARSSPPSSPGPFRTTAALAAVARYSPLLECGAGTGYWAALLARQRSGRAGQ